MDFNFTEEQVMLRDTVAAFLADRYGFEQRRAALAGEPGWRPDIWKALAVELGVLGAAVPEALGGFGGGPIENMILMEELGKALAVEPYLGTIVIGIGFLRHSGHAAAAGLAEGVLAGDTIFGFAQAERESRYNLAAVETQAVADGNGWVLNGRKVAVIGAPFSSHLLVTARTGGSGREAEGISVFLVETGQAGIALRNYRTFDGFLAADVRFDNVRLGSDGLIGERDGGLPLVERVVDEAIAASCGEACGVLRKLLDGTVDYTRQRKQFGAPISSFQALQHRMADMFIQSEQAVSMTLMANIRVSEADAVTRGLAVSAAKVQVARAGRFLGQSAIQLHGGMGMTDEMAIAHYFKRATMLETAFGSADHHLARYEALSEKRAA